MLYIARRNVKNCTLVKPNNPLHRRMAHHTCATSSGQGSEVHLHLKKRGQFEDSQVWKYGYWPKGTAGLRVSGDHKGHVLKLCLQRVQN